MERELWNILAAELTHLSTLIRRGRFTHPVTRIVRVYLWAVLHDRPVYWACDRRNWIGVKPPAKLPMLVPPCRVRSSKVLTSMDANAC